MSSCLAQPQDPVTLLKQVGASNELPESEELDALYDRFLVRSLLCRHLDMARRTQSLQGKTHMSCYQTGALRLLQVRREVRQVSAANLNALLRTADTARAARSAGDPSSPASRGDTLVTHEDFTTIRCAADAQCSWCYRA
jgi:MoxR domain in the MoxR-vWA-beta-propeller ternary systems